MTKAAGSALLRSLDEESWGERLSRARNSSKVGLRTAADLISREVMPTSFTSLSRLEDLPTVPDELRRRILATLTVIAYGYAPEAFELSAEDLPRSIDVEGFIRAAADLRKPHNSCISATAGQAA